MENSVGRAKRLSTDSRLWWKREVDRDVMAFLSNIDAQLGRIRNPLTMIDAKLWPDGRPEFMELKERLGAGEKDGGEGRIDFDKEGEKGWKKVEEKEKKGKEGVKGWKKDEGTKGEEKRGAGKLFDDRKLGKGERKGEEEDRHTAYQENDGGRREH